MDWNWFFSSAAQSAAAIVGIFAAFLITKIIGNQSIFNSKCNTLDELIADAKALEDEAGTRYFNWYNERKIDIEFDKIEEEFINEGVIFTPEEYYKKYNFPEFIEKTKVLNLLNVKCQEYRGKKEKDSLEVEAQLKKLGPGRAIVTQRQIHVPTTLTYVHKVAEERDLIDNLIVKIRLHCRHAENFVSVNHKDPESSPLITASLGLTLILFYFGVIYPLSFLPLRLDSRFEVSVLAFWEILFSLKGLILLVISCVFNAIAIVFFVINLRLKYPTDKIQELSKYSKISSYSSYLKNMEDNSVG